MSDTHKNDYISLLSLLKDIWSRKRFLIKMLLVFLVIGVFVALFTEKVYDSEVKFLSQSSSTSKVGGNWSNIASLIGINLSGAVENGEIPSNIYPKIINSVPYQKKLMDTKLTFKGVDTPITFRKYYTEIYSPDLVTKVKGVTLGLPGTIMGWLRGGSAEAKEKSNTSVADSIQFISPSEKKLRGILKESVQFSLDESDGVITIKAIMPEAIPAAQLAQSAQVLLQQRIIDYRIAKAQEQMKFIEAQFEDQKENFESAQASLAYYKDRNRFNTTEASQIRLRELQNEYDIAQSVFSELQRQKVAQSIQINKDTPLFTTLNPATVPLEPAAPSRVKIVLVSLLLGLFLGVLILLARIFISNFKTFWKKA
ncbi:Wzz/FepE/Etk N-terminal domain-containing protein [Flavobacteriaceae bacterium TK19130]|nr:Wzz/FepE/Etk N-terminal domain-containing protein [Thermobacterium salinum]